MPRVSWLVLVVLVLATPGLRGQDDEKVLGKTREEWIEVLKKGKEVKLRRAALIILDNKFTANSPGVVTAVIGALQKDESEQIRKEAAQILGKMGGDAKTAVLPLGETLARDKAPEVREAAARALGGPLKEFAKPAMPLLVEGLKDSDPTTRAAVAATLKEIPAEARLAITSIIDAIKDRGSNRFTQVHLIVLLSKFADESSKIIPVLLGLVNQADADPSVREAAISSLAHLGAITAPVQTALEGVLKDGKAPSSLRTSACAALVKIGSNPTTLWPIVKNLVTDRDRNLRVQAIRLAGKLGKEEPEAIAVLMARTNDENLEARVAAIQELGELGPLAKEAEAVLTTIVRNDSRMSIRVAAAAALKKIRGEVEKE